MVSFNNCGNEFLRVRWVFGSGVSPETLVSGTKTEAAWIAVTSHPVHGVDAQDVEAFGHDERRGVAEQHPPHVDLHHLTWRDEHTGDTLFTNLTITPQIHLVKCFSFSSLHDQRGWERLNTPSDRKLNARRKQSSLRRIKSWDTARGRADRGGEAQNDTNNNSRSEVAFNEAAVSQRQPTITASNETLWPEHLHPRPARPSRYTERTPIKTKVCNEQRRSLKGREHRGRRWVRHLHKQADGSDEDADKRRAERFTFNTPLHFRTLRSSDGSLIYYFIFYFYFPRLEEAPDRTVTRAGLTGTACFLRFWLKSNSQKISRL